MRILHVNKFLYRRGGAEGYMLDLGELQTGDGHSVEYFAMEHPDNEAATFDAFFPPRVELDPPPSAALDRLRTGASMVWSRAAQRGMERTVEAFRPDVIHLHNIYHQLSPSILRVPRRMGIPTVITLHDYKLVCPTYQMLDHGQVCEACLGRRFHHAVTRRCNADSAIASAMVAGELAIHTFTRAYSPIDVFVCPSEFLLAKMRAGGVYPDRLQHLPHFAKLQGIDAATEPGHGVVVAGRLAHEKGIDVAIRAVGSLTEVELTVCGDGPERAALEALAAEVAPGRVRFTGRLPATELHDVIRRAAVVVVPSRWYENQPMIVLESFACGRPVIATDLGGLPELVRPGVDGALVPADDPAALASSISQFVDDPLRQVEHGRRGRDRALVDFSVRRHLDGLQSVYSDAARAKSASSRG